MCIANYNLKQKSKCYLLSTGKFRINFLEMGGEVHPDGGKFEYLDKEIVAFRRITSNII